MQTNIQAIGICKEAGLLSKYYVKIVTAKEEIDLTEKYPLELMEIDEGDAEGDSQDLITSGVDGALTFMNVFAPFSLAIKFRLRAMDNYDYNLIKAELKSLLNRRNSYYVVHEKMPGKKYAVNQAEIEYDRKNAKHATLTITFNCFKGYSESLNRTIEKQPFIKDGWQFSQGLTTEDKQYQFNTNTFKVYNGSDDMVDPIKRHDLDIAISCVAAKNLTIINKSTGDVFKYNKPLEKANTLLLSGVYPHLDGIRCGIDTNHGIIRLAGGYNNFEITGAKDINIAFSFPFIFR